MVPFKFLPQHFFRHIFITLKRFPLAVGMSFALCLTSLFSAHLPCSLAGKIVAFLSFSQGASLLTSPFTLYAIFCAGIGLFISLQLLWEGQGWRSRIAYYSISFLLYGITSWYFQSQPEGSLSPILLISGFISFIGIAPFLGTPSTHQEMIFFAWQVFLQVGYALLAAIIFFAGCSALLFALFYLFSFQFYGDQYKDLAIITFTFLFPFLSFQGIPSSFQGKPVGQKILQGLLSYLILPFLLMYSVLLYAYMLKIIIMQSLPRGGVVYLVSYYGLIGIFSYLLASGFPSTSRLFVFFQRYFLKILIFPTILLGVAIWYRLHQYGLTEGRYVVLMIGLFFLCSICLSFVKDLSFKTKALYICIPLILIGASIGPWRLSKLPALTQLHILQEILKEGQSRKEGLPAPASHRFPAEKERKLSRILDYLCQNKERLGYLKRWLHDTQSITLKGEEGSKASSIAAQLGITYQEAHKSGRKFFSYRFSAAPYYYQEKGVIYTFLHLSLPADQLLQYDLKEAGKHLTCQIMPHSAVFSLQLNTKDLLKEDLGGHLKSLAEDRSLQPPLSFEIEKGRVILHTVEGEILPETGNIQLRRLEFTLFLS